MPRKSAASLAIVTPIVDHRLPVPDGMPEAQARYLGAHRWPNAQ